MSSRVGAVHSVSKSLVCACQKTLRLLKHLFLLATHILSVVKVLLRVNRRGAWF